MVYSIPSLVWFEQLLDPMKKVYFLKFFNRNLFELIEIYVWKPNFPRQAIAKILQVLHSRYPWYTPYRVCFDLNNSLTRWKTPFFEIL